MSDSKPQYYEFLMDFRMRFWIKSFWWYCIFIQYNCSDRFLHVLEMVKLVRFLRVMFVVFGMSGTLFVVFISCNILFDCLIVCWWASRRFLFFWWKKWENICFCRILMHIFAQWINKYAQWVIKKNLNDLD